MKTFRFHIKFLHTQTERDQDSIQIDTIFWMVDIGSFSNSNSPKKHFQKIYDVLESVKKFFHQLSPEGFAARVSDPGPWRGGPEARAHGPGP